MRNRRATKRNRYATDAVNGQIENVAGRSQQRCAALESNRARATRRVAPRRINPESRLVFANRRVRSLGVADDDARQFNCVAHPRGNPLNPLTRKHLSHRNSPF
jgi:hypothetical protein